MSKFPEEMNEQVMKVSEQWSKCPFQNYEKTSMVGGFNPLGFGTSTVGNCWNKRIVNIKRYRRFSSVVLRDLKKG